MSKIAFFTLLSKTNSEKWTFMKFQFLQKVEFWVLRNRQTCNFQSQENCQFFGLLDPNLILTSNRSRKYLKKCHSTNCRVMTQKFYFRNFYRSGKVIKGQEAHGVKSRYPEDVYPGNHVSVWGSFWSEGKWGYKCCHSFVKASYCTGEAGKAAFGGGNLLTGGSTSTSGGDTSGSTSSRKRTHEDANEAATSTCLTTTESLPPSATSSSAMALTHGKEILLFFCYPDYVKSILVGFESQKLPIR